MVKECTDVPPEIHEGIRRVLRHLDFVARRLCDEEYMADSFSPAALASYCDNEAERLEELLSDFGLPSKYLPYLDGEETEPERIERLLLRTRRRQK